jgi:transcription initiation factor TFIID subunit 6
LGDGGGDGDGGDGDGEEEEEEEEDASSIRIRELRHRLLSEELLLYYERVASTILSNDDDASGDDDDDGRVSRVVRGLRDDTGLQELVPFLSRYVASGLMSRRNLRRPDRCRRLVRVFDAMLDNPSLHLDLHLHQMFVPVGTCVVAGNLSSSSSSGGGGVVAGGGGDHWTLREEAARALVKACDVYGHQYPTVRPRVIRLLTQQALRPDRPLPTQYGGIVGISLFGPRAVDAFLLPIAREYWERWERELLRVGGVGDSNDANETGGVGAGEGGGGGSSKRRRRGGGGERD